MNRIKASLKNAWQIILRHRIKSGVVLILLIAYYFSLPRTLFSEPFSTVIESSDGQLLGAKIADDGQWRFPAADSVPQKFQKCIVYFEDANFYYHPGLNPASMWKAFLQNRKAGKVRRGGSTITQQVIRLSRKNKSRNYSEKIIEAILATRLEFRHSKEKILALYAAHAPFGGNVVGLEMASWRYFGIPSYKLSWAESATLAVLPNAPSLIYPGKNQENLKRKRDGLLKKLFENRVIDKMTYELALTEPLPQKPYDLPQTAPHLLDRIEKKDKGKRIATTIDIALQEKLNQIAKAYHNQYRQNEVHNLAILVVDVKTRNVIGYVGNSPTDADHDKDVDIIPAPRSTGSILKPLLFASMLDEGELLPNTLVPDVPVQISGFAPQNFDMTYDGAVPAQRALARSLNIPAVLMLQEHGVNKFYETLRKYKLRDINRRPDHYGLSLILGGAESNLWDMCRTYANLASTLNHFTTSQAKYRTKEFSELNYADNVKVDFGSETFQKTHIGAGAIYLTFDAMKEVNRPEGDEAWKFYDSSVEIAWKTGTSFGNRDAWAIGVDSGYAVGIWVGNASGEGRPELTGVNYAAPILFDVFNLLPQKKWFEKPLNDLEEAEICAKSGFLAQDDCPKTTQFIPIRGKNSKVCPYHKLVHLDKAEKFRVNSSCEDISNMTSKKWFALPPVMEWYYKSRHIDYKPIPPFRSDCESHEKGAMDFIYPKNYKSKIYLTKDFNGKIQPVIVKVAHSDPKAVLFWYVDNIFKGQTEHFHELQLDAEEGNHIITVADSRGNEIVRKLEIIRE